MPLANREVLNPCAYREWSLITGYGECRRPTGWVVKGTYKSTLKGGFVFVTRSSGSKEIYNETLTSSFFFNCCTPIDNRYRLRDKFVSRVICNCEPGDTSISFDLKVSDSRSGYATEEADAPEYNGPLWNYRRNAQGYLSTNFSEDTNTPRINTDDGVLIPIEHTKTPDYSTAQNKDEWPFGLIPWNVQVWYAEDTSWITNYFNDQGFFNTNSSNFTINCREPCNVNVPRQERNAGNSSSQNYLLYKYPVILREVDTVALGTGCYTWDDGTKVSACRQSTPNRIDKVQALEVMEKDVNWTVETREYYGYPADDFPNAPIFYTNQWAVSDKGHKIPLIPPEEYDTTFDPGRGDGGWELVDWTFAYCDGLSCTGTATSTPITIERPTNTQDPYIVSQGTSYQAEENQVLPEVVGNGDYEFLANNRNRTVALLYHAESDEILIYRKDKGYSQANFPDSAIKDWILENRKGLNWQRRDNILAASEVNLDKLKGKSRRSILTKIINIGNNNTISLLRETRNPVYGLGSVDGVEVYSVSYNSGKYR